MFKRLFLVSCFLFLGAFLWYQRALKPVDVASTTSSFFVIPKGQSLDTVAKRLQAQRLIRAAPAFKFYVVSQGLSTKIQAGDFRLKRSMSVADIVTEFSHGSLDIWVTLLEGWRKEEMAAKITAEFLNRDQMFDTAAFINLVKNEEGYLFPDTYLIPRDASASAIAKLLRQTFDQKVNLSQNHSGLRENQVIILASLLEREVNSDADRPIVAGILIKRLSEGHKLQVDATVQYVVGSRNCRNQTDCSWWPQSLTKADLELDSPYNTYRYYGLPPAPISNPGLSAIAATLSPASTNYLYYISDPKGQIHYAKTLEEHNANIRRYLKS